MGGAMTKVLPGLYVGSLDNAKNEEELIANGISHIALVQNAKSEIEKSPSVQYLHVIISEHDDYSLFRCVSDVNDFIHSTRSNAGNVLVCSDSGMSANVAVVAVYLMSVYRLDRISALRAIQGLKHGAHPVAPLQAQLDQFDSNMVPGSSSTPSPTSLRGDQPVVTVQMERQRMLERYGPWPGLEEDMQLLKEAMDSHKTLSDEGLNLLSDNPLPEIPPELPDCQASMIHPPPLSMDTREEWDSPQTPPPTPVAACLVGSHNIPLLSPKLKELTINLPFVTLPEDLEESAASAEHSNFFASSRNASETDLFPLDPSEAVIESASHDPGAVRWPVRTGRSQGNQELSADEIGSEPSDDFVTSGRGDSDDVPGAIAMPLTHTKPDFSHRQRPDMASSFHVRSSIQTTGDWRSELVPASRSLAYVGILPSHLRIHP